MDYKEFLEETVKNCKSKADLCRALDKKPTGGNYKTIDNIIRKYNLDISHFNEGPWNKGIHYYSPRYTLDEILVENSPYLSTTHLKNRLINEGILEPKCDICGKTERLELHHKNGNSFDNRLENLQILCIEHHYDTNTYRNNGKGRRHSSAQDLILDDKEQKFHEKARYISKLKSMTINEAKKLLLENPNILETENFCKKRISKNIEVECPVCHKFFRKKRHEQIYCSQKCAHRKSQKSDITKELLIEKMKELKGNFTQVGNFFGMTDNAIRKWCKKFDIPSKKKEMIEYLNSI